jgi:hypothetical protein
MDWDLQAEFQRGEVWTNKKKQRLIDTILRGWQMPSIHLLRSHDYGRMTVLDGQQRLVAIRDFMEGDFRVNGDIPPFNAATSSLGGLTYRQFPAWAQDAFDRYMIPVVRVEDYNPDEVAELFYRLNQGTRLTAAEHRNAFHGPVGKQIKDIANEFVSLSGDQSFLGFSNLRMAYDDVLAHLANTLMEGTLWSRVNSNSVTEMYKWGTPLPTHVEYALRGAIVAVAPALRGKHPEVKFSKASIYSWLVFAVRANAAELVPIDSIPFFISDFESARQRVFGEVHNHRLFNISSNRQYAQLLDIFTDRCSSRSAESSSVVLRDLVLWIFYAVATDHHKYNKGRSSLFESISAIVDLLEQYKFVSEDVLLETAEALGWGNLI